MFCRRKRWGVKEDVYLNVGKGELFCGGWRNWWNCMVFLGNMLKIRFEKDQTSKGILIPHNMCWNSVHMAHTFVICGEGLI